MFDFSAKKLRSAMKDKIARLVRTDPKAKVDASGYTPPDALDADVKTGARPLSRRQFRKGGKVVAMHGEHAKKHAGKKPRRSHRAMGGMDGDDVMSNTPAPRAPRVNVPMNPRYGAEAVQKAIDSSNRSGRKISRGEAAKIHRLLRGGYKSGGKALTADSYINRDVREANEERDGYKHVGAFKRGGKTMHDDVAEDKKLIKSMVKSDAIKAGKSHGGSCRCAKCSGGSMGRSSGGRNVDLDSLYGKESLPSSHVEAHKDFGSFKKMGWLSDEDRDSFIRKATEHLKERGKRAEGGKNWIKDAIKHPGSLHKALHVPKGEKIPAKKLEKATHSDKPGLAKKANLAKTLKGFHKKADGGSMYDGPLITPKGSGAPMARGPRPTDTLVPFTPTVRKIPPRMIKPAEGDLNDLRNVPVRKRGGKMSVSDGELEGTRPTGGRRARAYGGELMGHGSSGHKKKDSKTNINIIIGMGKGQGGTTPAATPAVPPRLPTAPVVVPPAGAGAPAGLGATPPVPPVPPVAPVGAPAGMPGRKAGGRVGHRSYKSVKDFDAGSGSGLGRLEKVKVYGHKA